jgi:hypothetical protein
VCVCVSGRSRGVRGEEVGRGRSRKGKKYVCVFVRKK